MGLPKSVTPAAFQFTHPGRGATGTFIDYSIDFYPVSIHAPREGCDAIACHGICLLNVSIHAPREGCDYQWSD